MSILQIARWGREEEDFLPSGQDSTAYDVREQLRKPWTCGEHEPVGTDPLSRGKSNLVNAGASAGRRER